MKKLEYKLSLETAQALAGLQKLAKGATDFDNKTKEITPDFLKVYEKEINKSIKTQNTLSLKLDKLNKEFADNAKAIELANQALKSDAFVESSKKVQAYSDEVKKINSELRVLAKEQKSINLETNASAFNENVAQQEKLKKKILEKREAIKSESVEYRSAEKARDALLRKEASLKTNIDSTTASMKKEEQASRKLKKDLDDLADKSEEVATKQSMMSESFKKFAMSAGTALAGFFAVDKAIEFGKVSIEAFKQAEMGYKAFASSVKANGESMFDATKAVAEITSNGGITNTQAQEALVNYLRMGFDVKEAKEQVIRELDLATERRQAHYKTAGEAVVVASQGYLQENSTNSDATGNSKNVSKIYEEYAKSVNKTVEQLTELDKKHAIQRESLKTHIEVVGAAKKSLDTLAGAEAQLEIEYTKTKETLGQALAPAYKILIESIKGTVTFTRSVISSFKEFGVSMSHISSMIGSFFKLLKTQDVKAFNKEMKELAKVRDESIKQINKESEGAYFGGQDDKTKTAKKEAKKSSQELEAEKERTVKNQLEIEKLGHEKSLIQLKIDLDNKKIELEKFKADSIKILGDISNIDIKLKNIEFDGVSKNLSASGLDTETRQSLELRQKQIEKEIAEISANSSSKIEQVKNTGSKASSGTKVTAQQLEQARISAMRDSLDSELSLYREQANRQVKVVQEKFNAFEISAEEYYSQIEKHANEDFARQEKIAQIELARAKSLGATNELERVEKLNAVAKAESNLALIQEQRKNVLLGLADEQARYQRELERFESEMNISRQESRSNNLIELERLDADLMLATQKISGEQRIALEADIQNKLYAVRAKALNDRRSLAKDPRETAQINAEIEQLELEHSVTMKTIANDMYLEQRKAYESAMSQMKSFGDEIWGDMRNGFANVKDIIIRHLQDIAMNLAKQALGYEQWFSEGGALSNFIKRLTGTPDAPTSTGAGAGVIAGVLGQGSQPGASTGSGTLESFFGSGAGAMTINAATVNLNSATGSLSDALSPALPETSSIFESLTSKIGEIFNSLSSTLSSLFTSFGSMLSSSLSGLGGGGSGLGGLASLFSSFASFDVGADNLSRDQIAKVHKGERILTARENKTASPLLDNPEQFIRNAVSGASRGNQVINFHLSGTMDKRTQDQLANVTTDSLTKASRNR